MSTVHGGQGSIITQGLVLRLDAANPRSYEPPYTSTTWKDISGNGNDGTLTNGPTFNSANGGSIAFDGSNDYVDCGTNNSLKITGSLTLSCWISSSASTGTYICKSILVFGAPNQKVYEIGVLNNVTYFQLGNGTTNSSISVSAASILDNKWHYVTATWDGTTNTNGLLIYYDGVIVSQGTSPINTIQQTNDTLQIGYGRRFPFNGKISSTQIYNRALSATEVLQNFNATRARFGI